MLSIRKKGKSAFKNEEQSGSVTEKTWDISQDYELKSAIGFMQSPPFQKYYKGLLSGKLNISVGHRDDLILREFFGGSAKAFDNFVKHLKGRTTLDIGPCVSTPTYAWDTAAKRYAIEPLYKPIVAWQRANLGVSCFEGIECFAKPAEERIDKLVGAVDGAILCRNMLDHTPLWPFVLSNISAYAAPGCKLLFWTDLDHHGTADEGHYDIGSDKKTFKNLIEALGFKIIREYSIKERTDSNWGCYAEKI